MIVTTNLASTVLMGVFLVAVLAVFARLRTHRGETTNGERSAASDLPRITEDAPPSTTDLESGPVTGSSAPPIAWVVGFLGLVVVVGGGAIAFVAGNALPQIGTQAAGAVLAIVFGGLVCGYLFSGVYLSLRSHGRKSAEATGVALWLLGLIAVGVIAAQLVFLA